MRKSGSQSIQSPFLLAATIILGTVLIGVGCGGGHTQVGQPSPTPTVSPSPTPTPAALTSAQLRIGDAPSDRVIDFEVSFGPGPLVVNLSNSQSVNLTVRNNRWELSHMAGKMEPLSVESFPQGAVTSIQIPLSNPEVTYLDDAGALQTFLGSSPQVVNVTLNPPLVIGSAPAIVTLDINVAGTLTYDQATGKVTAINFSSTVFTFATKAIASAAEQQDDDGEIEGVTGKVTALNGSSFELDSGQGGASLTFVTDGTTRFDGVTPAALLNQIVKIEGFTQADGSVFAAEVEGLQDSVSGSELEGMIISEDGWPLSSSRPSIEVLAQDGIGNGMDSSKMGQPFWIDITDFRNFTVDWGKIVNVGWNFDGTAISPAQRVQIELPAGVPAPSTGNSRIYTAIPTEIKLEQQSITGQVNNFNQATGEFDLNLPADSYVTLLTDITSVHVYLKPETDMRLQSIANGDRVRVRGLLFFTLTASIPNLGPKPWGYFRMIARRITAP